MLIISTNLWDHSLYLGSELKIMLLNWIKGPVNWNNTLYMVNEIQLLKNALSIFDVFGYSLEKDWSDDGRVMEEVEILLNFIIIVIFSWSSWRWRMEANFGTLSNVIS